MVGARRGAVDADARKRLKIGFLLLVAFSGTMMGVQGGGSWPLVVVTTLVGLLVGWLLLWYLAWITG